MDIVALVVVIIISVLSVLELTNYIIAKKLRSRIRIDKIDKAFTASMIKRDVDSQIECLNKAREMVEDSDNIVSGEVGAEMKAVLEEINNKHGIDEMHRVIKELKKDKAIVKFGIFCYVIPEHDKVAEAIYNIYRE